MNRWFPSGVCGLFLAVCGSGASQDYSVLRINEVIAENDTELPRDVQGSTTDMVELYNSGPEPLVLGGSDDSQSIALTDRMSLPADSFVWPFPPGTTIQAGKFLLVFCDGNTRAGACELHANFRLKSDGSEPISLWGPVTGVEDGKPVRKLLDQVWLPPLPSDVSVGRYPDGAGPAPCPLGQVKETFFFHPPGTSTFGQCVELRQPCAGDESRSRSCSGAPNSPGGNVRPKIVLRSHSTSSPGAGEPVKLRVEISDEKGPTPPNIRSVEIVYRVDGGVEQAVSMTYDSAVGVEQGIIEDCNAETPGIEPCPNPFDLWTFWDGEIPGQPAGARVEFFLRARDAEGGEDTVPNTLCPEGVGPCDRHLGGPGCVRDGVEPECRSTDSPRFLSCKKPYTFRVAHAPGAELVGVVINEVVSRQNGLLRDITEPPCSVNDRCQFRGDFVELFNSSPDRESDLSGLWLSNNPFNPRGWQFPPGSRILPQEHLIVWADADGGKCPDPSLPAQLRPCLWECPDPTDPSRQEYHTNFTLDASGDQIYLFDSEEKGFGALHGVQFGVVGLNHSLSLVPDGDRGGCWINTETPTPRDANQGFCPKDTAFRRGDSNSDCAVNIADAVFTLGFLFQGSRAPMCEDSMDADDDGVLGITDAIFTLGYLFLGKTAPPAPGPDLAGPDPTDDVLGACFGPAC